MYVWNDEARSLRIELAVAVVGRLSLDAMEAFKSVPRRGLEIGGLLLGKSHPGLIRIEDYVDVPSEHRTGPSYQLSSADLETLDNTFDSHPDAVGIYRTATQSEILTLQQDDTTLFERHFRSRLAILLLVHPATRKAAFCLRGGGGLTIVHEFPFHSAELVPGAPEPEEPPAVAPAEPKPPKSASVSGVRVWSTRAGALVLGAVIGALAWHYLQPAKPHVRAAKPAQPSPAIVAKHDPAHVSLDVTRDGRALRLHWDQQADALRNADHALLHILDGNHETNLNLTVNELNNGSLSYWADTPDVTFRLEVFGPGVKTDDTVRAVSGTAGGQPASSAAPPATRAQANAWPRAQSGQSDRDPDNTDDGGTASAAALEQRPSPFQPPPKPTAPPPLEAITTPAPHPAATSATAAPPVPSRSSVEVSAEPVSGSRLGRLVKHVPLLRRLHKEQGQVPPEPIHETKPVVSEAESHNLTGEVPIDVRVYVTESGSVNLAELANKPSAQHRELAEAAVLAARQWSFRPARVGEENVPSEVVLHFRFRPLDGAQ